MERKRRYNITFNEKSLRVFAVAHLPQPIIRLGLEANLVAAPAAALAAFAVMEAFTHVEENQRDENDCQRRSEQKP
jgi:uncharacterized protein YjiK